MAADAGRTQSQDPADMFEGKNVLHVRFEKPSRSVAKPSIIAAPVLFVFQKRIFQNRKHKFSLRLDIARMQQSLAIGSVVARSSANCGTALLSMARPGDLCVIEVRVVLGTPASGFMFLRQ